MAERRMFSKQIIESDRFCDLSHSAQALYFHLNIEADDDGMVNSPRKVQRMIGAGNEHLEELTAAGFVLPFPSGVVCVKHWLINNQIRKDRRKDTAYRDEFEALHIKPNGAYTLNDTYPLAADCQPSDNQTATKRQPSDNQTATQDRLEEIREEKKRKGKESGAENVTGYYKNLKLSTEEVENIKSFYKNGGELLDRVSRYLYDNPEKTYKNHYTLVLKIAREEGYAVNE